MIRVAVLQQWGFNMGHYPSLYPCPRVYEFPVLRPGLQIMPPYGVTVGSMLVPPGEPRLEKQGSMPQSTC